MENPSQVWPPVQVLVAVDGSETSIRAARYAADLARQGSGTLTILTVVRTPEGWWGIDGEPPTPEAMASAVTEARHRVLDKVRNQIDTSGIEVNTESEVGDPATTVVAACNRIEADLLVIGRRGAGLVERMLIGSVADRLAHHSPCPILIVP